MKSGRAFVSAPCSLNDQPCLEKTMASAEQTWRGRPELEGHDHRSHQEKMLMGPEPFPQNQASCAAVNVGSGERLISLAAGSLLSLLGLERRDGIGLMVAGLGGAMLYRGVTGRCHLYQALDVSTVEEHPHGSAGMLAAGAPASCPVREGIHLTQSFLINQPAEKLYDYWRRFENLPNFMTHLKSVQPLEGNRSHWVADAPWIVGGQVEWDAEMIADEPHSRIAWRSLAGSTVQHHGSVAFTKAAGERGTAVRVEMNYLPPGGKLGQWVSKLFGDAPEQQIREDMRNFKRLMEVGEIPTIAGQPRGLCSG
jgi:uncharacterized membrane protein